MYLMNHNSDVITIKNAYRAQKKSSLVSMSKFKKNICHLLKTHKFIKDFKIIDQQQKKFIKISLFADKKHFTDLRLISKPGCRSYSSASQLPWGQTPRSLVIVSTSKGLMSQKMARKQNVGGEVIAEIW